MGQSRAGVKRGERDTIRYACLRWCVYGSQRFIARVGDAAGVHAEAVYPVSITRLRIRIVSTAVHSENDDVRSLIHTCIRVDGAPVKMDLAELHLACLIRWLVNDVYDRFIGDALDSKARCPLPRRRGGLSRYTRPALRHRMNGASFADPGLGISAAYVNWTGLVKQITMEN